MPEDEEDAIHQNSTDQILVSSLPLSFSFFLPFLFFPFPSV